ncbi:MAG: beta-galactosidase, partial [Verrucomicrobia bacterium]|nr:beta-galactosidase [Verrucomicrobiota bacterium]
MKTMLAAVLGMAGMVSAQVIDNTDTRVQTTLDPGLKRIGTLKPKGVHEIGSSRWTLGCETMDREYTNYDAFKEYLPPLGIRRIRLQGGWARTEKDPGIYDFAWLDHIIDDARSRGLEIWLETSYGNPAYPGGGGRTLSGGFPTSEAGLAAWDKWVELMATRYKGKVRDWSMWNEPDGHKEHTPERVTEFNIRTAEIVKRVIPDARIAGLVLCGPRTSYIEHFVKTLAERNRTELFHWVVYHAYARNPDDPSAEVLRAKEIVAKHAPALKLWQGESGTQSEWCGAGALSKYPWTELTQAKWNTRRMLGDIGHGSDSSVFSAADLDYRTTSFHNGLVRYGLIKTAGAAEGYRVLKVKTAYYAVQNVVSVFNDSLEWTPDFVCEVQCAKPLAVFGHRDIASGRPVCVFWDKSGAPSNSNTTVAATLTIPKSV